MVKPIIPSYCDESHSTSEEDASQHSEYNTGSSSTSQLSDDDDGYFRCTNCDTILMEKYDCNVCSGEEIEFVPDSQTRDLNIIEDGYDSNSGDIFEEETHANAVANQQRRRDKARERNRTTVTHLSGTHSFTICTYNTWRLGKKNGDIQREIGKITDKLKECSILILQEVQGYSNEEFINFCNQFGKSYDIVKSPLPTAKSNSSKQRDYYVTIFNKERLKLDNFNYIESELIQNSKFNYVPFRVTLSLNRESIELKIHIISVHLSISKKTRELEVQHIGDYIATMLNDQNEVFIVIGDFNCSDSVEVSKMNSILAATVADTHSTITANEDALPTNSLQTKPYDGAYIFTPILSNFTVDVENFEVKKFGNQNNMTRIEYRSAYSDHAPCFFKIRVKSRTIEADELFAILNGFYG